eukprot:1128503-Amphidinium_carterae.1
MLRTGKRRVNSQLQLELPMERKQGGAVRHLLPAFQSVGLKFTASCETSVTPIFMINLTSKTNPMLRPP